MLDPAVPVTAVHPGEREAGRAGECEDVIVTILPRSLPPPDLARQLTMAGRAMRKQMRLRVRYRRLSSYLPAHIYIYVYISPQRRRAGSDVQPRRHLARRNPSRSPSTLIPPAGRCIPAAPPCYVIQDEAAMAARAGDDPGSGGSSDEEPMVSSKSKKRQPNMAAAFALLMDDDDDDEGGGGGGSDGDGDTAELPLDDGLPAASTRWADSFCRGRRRGGRGMRRRSCRVPDMGGIEHSA